LSLIGQGHLSPIGIDADGRFIKAAQLARTPCGWSLKAATRFPRPEGDTEIDEHDVERLGDVLRRQGFSGSRVVLAVPEEKLVTSLLELPPKSSGAPLDEIARAELANLHGYDVQAAETASWDLPTSGRATGSSRAMAVACRHADAEALLDVFEGGGLEVIALDARFGALQRACGAQLSTSGITVILDLEWNRATLLLLYQNTVVYQWTLADGGIRHLSKSLSASLSLEEEMVQPLLSEAGLSPRLGAKESLYEAVQTPIKKHLDAVVRALRSPLTFGVQLYPASAPSRLLLTGYGATIPGVDDYLQAETGLEARIVAPADVVACPEQIGAKGRDPSLTVAVGLARFAEGAADEIH
jgi:Tfp pilus assembly PilM family ATPase